MTAEEWEARYRKLDELLARYENDAYHLVLGLLDGNARDLAKIVREAAADVGRMFGAVRNAIPDHPRYPRPKGKKGKGATDARKG